MKFIIASVLALFLLTGCFEEGSTESNATKTVTEVVTSAFSDKVDEVAETVKTEVTEQIETVGTTETEVVDTVEVVIVTE